MFYLSGRRLNGWAVDRNIPLPANSARIRCEIRPPSRRLEAVEFANLRSVHWFNHRWLLWPISHEPPAEYEAQYYQQAAVA